MKFSIIIETTNVHEENNIGIQHALPEIVRQTKGENAEIILVDGTKSEAVKKLARKYPVRYFSRPDASYVECKNYGLKHAKGDIIILLDSDCVLQPEWFVNMKRSMNKKTDIVTGFTHYPLTNLRAKVLSVFDFLPEGKFIKTNRFSANNLAVRRSIIEKHKFIEGLPDITAASVGILGWEWHSNGYAMYFNPLMEIMHNFYSRVFNNRLNAGFGGIVMRKAEKRFPQAQLLASTGILFPFIFYAPRVVHDIKRMTKARKLLRISWPEYLPACMLIAYYRFIELIGMTIALCWPRYFSRPGQIRAF